MLLHPYHITLYHILYHVIYDICFIYKQNRSETPCIKNILPICSSNVLPHGFICKGSVQLLYHFNTCTNVLLATLGGFSCIKCPNMSLSGTQYLPFLGINKCIYRNFVFFQGKTSKVLKISSVYKQTLCVNFHKDILIHGLETLSLKENCLHFSFNCSEIIQDIILNP